MSYFARREAAERQAERRRREDDAPRLAELVPELETLRLDISEQRSGIQIVETSYIKRIPVAHAPALFELPCQDPTCKEGGHDVTSAIMRSLRMKVANFEGDDACRGQTGNVGCQRILRYVASATYRAPGSSPR